MNRIEIIEHGIVSRRMGSKFPYHGWPTVARIQDDVLAAAGSAFRMAHTCPFGKVAMFTSGDEGKTWSPPAVLVDTLLDDRDAGLCRLDDGSILLNWFDADLKARRDDWINWFNIADLELRKARIREAGEDYYQIATAYLDAVAGNTGSQIPCGSYLKKSTDCGHTWTEPVSVPITSPHGPIQLSDGNVLYVGKNYSDREGDVSGIFAYQSTDGGLSWKYLSTVPMCAEINSKHPCEPHAVQMGNGKILCLIRIDQGFTIAQSISEDNGKSWSEAVSLGVNGSPPHVIQHSSGTLICAYGRRQPPFGQRVMLSNDCGKTWLQDLVLRDDGFSWDLGYPSSVELKDGSILTVYYQALNKGEPPSFLYTKWKLCDMV